MAKIQNDDLLSFNYPPSMPYIIDQIWLTLNPDFESKTLFGEEQLKLTARQTIDKLELDCATEMKIVSVSLSFADQSNDPMTKLEFDPPINDKLVIKLGSRSVQEGGKFHLLIRYSTVPSKGFYFIDAQEKPYKRDRQAWTQGEAIDSKYWFPTFDHPQMKFPREVSVIVPKELAVISNGELDIRKHDIHDVFWSNAKEDNIQKAMYVWEEVNPNPAYLTCIVIGNYEETSNGFNYKDRVPLRYYVPKDRIQDADRTFKDTPRMMEFFETFFGIEYPYGKYSQVIIEDFPYGGMENTTCTTLMREVLHDERAHLDFTSDDVIAHELAHHWFGDLVTCRDWEHIWLNEGFASYSEALYWQSSRGENEFLYYLVQMADIYLKDAQINGKHELVTKNYLNPDSLFDLGHTYKKGGWVVHMIRQYIGNESFKKSLNRYLDKHRNRTAETDDIRQVFEEISGRSLERFFDQWLFGKGHPELDIQISQEENNTLKLRIMQIQSDDTVFNFPLDLKLIILTADGGIDTIQTTIEISEKVSEKVFQIPQGSTVKCFSIDPDLKILKEIKTIDTPLEMLIDQLNDRVSTTIIERIDTVRYIGQLSANDKNVVDVLTKAILEEDLSLDNTFWGVSFEAAKVLSSMLPTEITYDALMHCYTSVDNPRTKAVLVEGLRKFDNSELSEIFQTILDDVRQSYFVQSQAARGFGKMADDNSISILEQVLEKDRSFKNVVAQGAIVGLRIFATTRTRNQDLKTKIINLLIDKTSTENYENVRIYATSALGFFISDRNGNIVNPGYEQIIKLLTDTKSVLVRNYSCVALGRAFHYTKNQTVIDQLKNVAEHDPDGQVRQTALDSISLIKKDREVIAKIRFAKDEKQFLEEKLQLMETRITQI
jgi:aminopeptidase N